MLARDTVLLILGDVGVVTRLAQDFLAAHHLALERVLHAVHQGQLGLEVGDHGGHVRHLGHAREGRATLEVNEDEVELLGRVGQGQSQDEGTKDLRLTRTGCADQEAVGAHALLGGLFDVEQDRDAFGGDTEGDAQAVPALATHPGPLGIVVSDVAQLQELHEVHGALDVRAPDGRLALFLLGAHGEGSQSSGDGLGLSAPHPLPFADDRLVTEKVDLEHAARLSFRHWVDEEAHRRRARQRPPLLVQVHDSHAGSAVARTDLG